MTSVMRLMQLSSVVLPALAGPMTPRISCSRTWRVTSASTCWRPYQTDRFSISTLFFACSTSLMAGSPLAARSEIAPKDDRDEVEAHDEQEQDESGCIREGARHARHLRREREQMHRQRHALVVHRSRKER